MSGRASHREWKFVKACFMGLENEDRHGFTIHVYVTTGVLERSSPMEMDETKSRNAPENLKTGHFFVEFKKKVEVATHYHHNRKLSDESVPLCFRYKNMSFPI